MAFRTKGKDKKEREAAEAKASAEAEEFEADKLASLLALEDVARDLAHRYPDGPNCDAVKAGLLNAAHGIAHVRKALANNRRLA